MDANTVDARWVPGGLLIGQLDKQSGRILIHGSRAEVCEVVERIARAAGLTVSDKEKE